MFDQNGLSLDQAPPISVVLRFFLAGAVFGIGAGLLMAWQGVAVWEPTSLYGRSMTHIMTLGVMLSFMLGALFQMLPVIAGVVLQSPVRLASWVQVPFVAGVLILLWAFFRGTPFAFILAGILLALSLLPLVSLLLWRLLHLKNHSASSRGMGLALMSLLIVVGLSMYLSGALGGVFDGAYYPEVRVAHYSFGLFGWIAFLIIAISFQVVEMFYVTPAHPAWIRSWMGFGLLGILLLAFVIRPWLPSAWLIAHTLIGIFLFTYAVITLRRFSQRKRPLTDATVWFWRLGLVSLIIDTVFLVTSSYVHAPWLEHAISILFASFALSILFAMLYKIIPFLTWFHLNSQGYFTAPMMHEVIHPKTASKHLYIHLATLLVALIGIAWNPAAHMAGALLVFSFAWLLYQILRAGRLYRHTQEHGERFDLSVG